MPSFGADEIWPCIRHVEQGNRGLYLRFSPSRIGDEGPSESELDALIVAINTNTAVREVCVYGYSSSSRYRFRGIRMPEGLLEGMLSRPALVHLFLEYNGLGGSGGREDATSIAKMIRSTGTLDSLSLRCNQFDAEDCRILAKALCGNQSLTKLDMSWNCLDDACAIAFAGNLLKTNRGGLKRLNLNYNKITADGLCAIAGSLRITSTLGELDCEGIRYSRDAFFVLKKLVRYNHIATFMNFEGSMKFEDSHQGRLISDIRYFLSDNRSVRGSFLKALEHDEASIPSGLLPRALSKFADKPGLMYWILKDRPGLLVRAPSSGDAAGDTPAAAAAKRRRVRY